MLQQDASTTDKLLELDAQLCFALHAASRTLTRIYTERLSEFELTYTQYLVMLVLWEWDRATPPRPTVRALGERLDLDSGTLTPVLRRLADKRLIVRERGQQDERELCLRLTKEGKALKRRVANVPRAMLVESPLPLAEIVDLRDRLKRFRSAVTGTASTS